MLNLNSKKLFLLWIVILLFSLFKNWDDNVNFYMTIFISIVWFLLISMVNNKSSWLLTNLMGMFIVMFFTSSALWKFFILYEASVLPMSFIILGWGTNPSRFSAAFYMIVYTLIFSLPSLCLLVYNWKMLGTLLLLMNNYSISFLSMMVFFFLFLIKTPIYFFHYWLPKAHVEASTLGSIILAGGLLKMGSIGFMKILKWLKFSLNNNYFIMSSMMTAFLCLVQSDFKKLVALLSVSHMSASLASLNTFYSLGLLGFLLMSLLHTITSSMLFYFSGIMISLSKTRIMYLSFMSSFKLLNIVFILIILSSLGMPPFYSMILEIISLSVIFMNNYLTFSMLFLLIMFLLTSNLFILNFYKIESFQILKNSNYIFMLTLLSILMTMWSHSSQG